MDLRRYLAEYHIDLTGILPLDACEVRRSYLLERAGFDMTKPLFVQLFAIPYLSHDADLPDRNVSAYAVSEDYHLFVRELFDDLLPRLHTDFEGYRFVGFADHSPIAEVNAAVAAGLGVLGDNHLLLTERYSSYVFLAEIITDLPLDPTPTSLPPELRHCHGCGKCTAACPMTAQGGICRSALTQKKDELTDGERVALAEHALVWGCDICQEVCPYTAHARARGTIWSPIPFFARNTLAHLSIDTLDAMDEPTFARRAFAWRGRRTVRRNLTLHSTSSVDKEDI